MFRGHPQSTARLLSKIPRLEPVADIVRWQQMPEHASPLDEHSRRGAEMLNLALESGVQYHGVLCGRATWQDGVPVYVKDGVGALDEWLNTVGAQNVQNVNKVLESAHPWYEARSIEL